MTLRRRLSPGLPFSRGVYILVKRIKFVKISRDKIPLSFLMGYALISLLNRRNTLTASARRTFLTANIIPLLSL